MRTILAICLLTAAFATIPTGEAGSVCDPTYTVCAGSFGYGSCDSAGYAYNYASAYVYDGTQYYAASASTYCDAFPGWSSYSSIGAGVTHCDFSTWQCEGAGAAWYSYGSYCETYVYASAGGQYVFQSLGCPAGAPPAIPALIP